MRVCIGRYICLFGCLSVCLSPSTASTASSRHRRTPSAPEAAEAAVAQHMADAVERHELVPPTRRREVRDRVWIIDPKKPWRRILHVDFHNGCVCLSVCLSVCLYACVCLSASLSVCLYCCFSVCVSVSLFVSVYVSMYLSMSFLRAHQILPPYFRCTR